jgi:hypothetical protein
VSLALSGLAGLLQLQRRETEPWVVWLGIGIAAAVAAVVLILKFRFPHLIADERRNGRVFLALFAIWMTAVLVYALINFEP